MIKIFMGVLITISSLFACGPECYEDKNTSKLENFLSEKWKNDIIFDASYQDISSDYHNFRTTDDSIQTIKLDWMSQIKITDNLGLTSTVRAIQRTYKSDFEKQEDPQHGRDLNMIPGDLEYDDIYFRALYLTYQLPAIGDYHHMIAAGTMPFQNGSWTNYKNGRPQEANGLSMMFDMPFDAVTYVADISRLTDMDFFQIRVGYGEYMRLRNLYPQNEHLGQTPYGTNVTFINFDMQEGNHKIKLEAYRTEWMFEDTYIGTADTIGIGYAYDRMEEDGYVVYGTLAGSKATGSYMDYITKKMTDNRDKLIAGYVQAGYTLAQATAYLDANLANMTPEFVAESQGLTLEDTGLVQGESATGWAFQVGGKKEFWWEEFDVYPYVGFEYFHSSKDWVATTLRGFPRNGIDPLIKGEATDLYAGIKFDSSKTLTFSWIHENRKWSPTAINDVVGITTDQTNRNILTERDIFRVDFTWMFLGL